MIKKLLIQNFQSHHDSILEFKRGVNVIIGLSDSGKSSIRRAFQAVLGRKDFFLTIGRNEGKIEIEFDDAKLARVFEISKMRKCPNCKVEISKNNPICDCGEVNIYGKTSKDFYILNDDKTNIFKSFGVSLPQEILIITRIFPIKFLDFEYDLNISSQHSDMFFIGETFNGGPRNKIISYLVPDSDKVDFLIKSFNSELMLLNSEITINHNELTNIQNKKKAIDKIFDITNKLKNDVLLLSQNIESAKIKIEMLNKLKNEFKKTKNLLLVHDSLNKFKIVLKQVDKKIMDLINKSEKIKRLKYYKSVLPDRKINFVKKEFVFSEFDILEQKKNSVQKLKWFLKQMTMISEQIEKLNIEITVLRKNKNKKMLDLEEYFVKNPICPLTKQKYYEKCISILKEDVK